MQFLNSFRKWKKISILAATILASCLWVNDSEEILERLITNAPLFAIVGPIDSGKTDPILKYMSETPPSVIVIYIDSSGGEVDPVMDVINMANEHGFYLICIGGQIVVSSAAILLTQCHRRTLYTYTKFMMHRFKRTNVIDGSTYQLQWDTSAYMTNIFFGISEYSGMDFEVLKRYVDGGIYLSPEHALSYNLIDQLLEKYHE